MTHFASQMAFLFHGLIVLILIEIHPLNRSAMKDVLLPELWLKVLILALD